MPISTKDSDNISTIHTAERLQVNLLTTKENAKEMILYYQNQSLMGA